MMKEGFSLFLVNTLFVADKIMEGGGGGGGEIPQYHSDFFSQIQIFFTLSFRLVSP